MQTTPNYFVLFCLIILVNFGCSGNADKSFSEEQLRNALLGEWIMTDIPAAEELWQFRKDGTYKMKMGEYEDFGTWQLNKRKLVLDEKSGEAEEIFIANNKLEWGTYTFDRTGSAPAAEKTTASTDSDPGTIIGKWKLQHQGEESIYEFKANNTYSVVLGKGSDALNYSGTWEEKDGNMVLDGHNESSAPFELKNGKLYWREDEYQRVGQEVRASTDENLFQKLVGTWTTKEFGPEIRFTFSSDGTFTSFDGRYESKGKWELSEDELILDGYRGSASAISITGNRLTWDEVNYTKR